MTSGSNVCTHQELAWKMPKAVHRQGVRSLRRMLGDAECGGNTTWPDNVAGPGYWYGMEVPA